MLIHSRIDRARSQSVRCDIQVLARAANRTMIHSLHRTLSFFLGLLSLPVLCQGWETGSEYLYDYSGLLVTGIVDADHLQSAAVQIIAKLTVQSVDDETLMLKMSEIRVTRDGNYSSNGKASDPILLPVGLADGEKEAIGDSLHLLSTFAVIHNKGSITNLVVESEEPTWSVNVKKAVASNLQLDVSGVRSGLDGGVFGERNAPALSSLEDGVTGDCFTTLRITRLPFYQVIQNHDLEAHKIIGEMCRSTKVFEIIKTKDFDQCRKDPLKISSNPHSSASFLPQHKSSDSMLQRFTAYKYLACGESSEKMTVVRMEGIGEMIFSGPIKLKTEQIVSLVIQSRGQIRNLLPSLSQPQVIDDLTFSFEEDPTAASAKDVEAVFEALQEVGQTLAESTISEDDISKKLSIISQIISRLDDSQLREIWLKTFQPGNATVRDLFVDCTAASGSQTAAVFLVDLIERRELGGFQAVWTLMSLGHSMQYPHIPTLRRFVAMIRSEAAQASKLLKHTALMASADLLYRSCVLSTANCNADAQVITEEFLPLLVRELETAQTAIDRLAAILAVGALGLDDVLLLLVPYIRGEDVTARIAAIMSLERLMDFSSDKVTPLLASLADNVAERPEIRMAAISMLLLHKKTPLKIWKKIASRTWFDPSHQVAVFTCDIIQSVSGGTRSSEDESTSIKARSVIGLVRPCSGRSEFEHFASVKDNTAGFSSLLAFWRLRDSSLPVYLQHQLFRQLGSFRSDLAKVSIWNFNMESVWSQLLKHDDDIQPSSEPKSYVFWDQLSLRFRTNEQPTVGLFHARLLGSTMQTLFNLQDIDREYMIREFFSRHINIRFVKFQQLIDIRTHVPTELGLPARFTFSLTALASASGHIHQPEINVTASLYLKWATESRIQCPFSGHHVAAGVENTADIRAPVFFISNGSLLWIPPDRIYDLAYFNIMPYTLTSRTADHSSETLELAKANHISTKPPSVSVAQLSLNLRLESTSQLPQEDPASAWLNSLMKEYSCDFGHFRLDDFQQRVYRLRYLPEGPPLSSVSLSASFNTETIQGSADVQYILGVNGSMEWEEDGTNDTTSLFDVKDDSIHVYKGGITVQYGNGSMLNWAAVEVVAQSPSEKNEWNITASGSTIGLVRNWLNSKNIKYSKELGGDERSITSPEGYNNASEPQFHRIHFKLRESEAPLLRYASISSMFTAKAFQKSEKTKIKKCFIHSDRVVTYDGAEYSYAINECHHLLTADCGQKKAKYAIMGTNESHGMVVRITLEKDVIDVSSAGNISINGIEANFTASRMRIHMGEKVIAIASLTKDNTIHLRLSEENLDILVEKSTITLSAGEKLLGHACGMCGDGDSEVTGEFKTSNRCALSSGTLMAASFQINVGPENCPSLSDEVLQALLMESYPCYSVDEQVASVLPLPLEF